MEMRYGLTSIGTTVGDDTIAVFDACELCDFRDIFKNIRNDTAVCARDFIHTRNVCFGNDENMDRRLGRDVAECENLIILVNLGGRDHTVNDFAEKTVFHNREAL